MTFAYGPVREPGRNRGLMSRFLLIVLVIWTLGTDVVSAQGVE